jgi:hypothetical protein
LAAHPQLDPTVNLVLFEIKRPALADDLPSVAGGLEEARHNKRFEDPHG